MLQALNLRFEIGNQLFVGTPDARRSFRFHVGQALLLLGGKRAAQLAQLL
jgi:hypothetical protein